MKPAPLVSIVIPVFNDESTLAAALDSCLAQTLEEIEVICVDDASTDRSVAVIERYRERDARVRLVQHDANRSAFQARRTGILAAAGTHVLFVDGDDELMSDAARTAARIARETGADIVGFGVTIVGRDGRTGGAYERRLQPTHRRLDGPEVLRGLFPIGEQAQGQLWRYLFTARVLQDAYALLPDDLVLNRVNDLPVAFLAAVCATRYASTRKRLYRYHLGRGGSGHPIESHDRARFYVGAIDSIDSIRSAVDALTRTHGALVRDCYESVRQSMIAYVCHHVATRSDGAVARDALQEVFLRASPSEAYRATARFYPDSLSALARYAPYEPLRAGARNVLLATSSLREGRPTAVLLAQAHHLAGAGYRVTIAARAARTDPARVPPGVALVELRARGMSAELAEWGLLCRSHKIDVVIDHRMPYTPAWPAFALVARAEGAATVGWMHDFVLRLLFDDPEGLTLLEQCSPALSLLVVPSPLDVSYLALRRITHVTSIPDPPSPVMLAEPPAPKSAPDGRISLVWFGPVDGSGTRLRELFRVGRELRELGVDFDLTVIGAEGAGAAGRTINADARRHGLGDRVTALGPLHGAARLEAIDAADVFVSAGIVEGYRLTIAEAQSRRLPVAMYALPWLSSVRDDDGLLIAPQGDAASLARQIAHLIGDAERYTALSEGSTRAAARVRALDVGALYGGVIEGTTATERNPEPTAADAARLLDLLPLLLEEGSCRRSRGDRRRGADASTRLRTALARVPGLRRAARSVRGWLAR